MNLLKAEISKTLIELRTYYSDHIVDIVIKYFLFLTFFLGLGTKNVTNNTFFIGYSFWIIASYIISEASVQVSFEKQVGTIEQLFIKPYSSSLILAVRSVLMFTVSFAKFVVLTGIIWLTTKISVSVQPLIFAVYFVSLFGFLGLGLFLSALTLIFTKTASFESILSYALLTVSGVFIPIEKLSPLIHKIIHPFPYFYGIELAQKVGSFQTVATFEWVLLVILNFLALMAGFILYEFCLKYVRRHGLINKY